MQDIDRPLEIPDGWEGPFTWQVCAAFFSPLCLPAPVLETLTLACAYHVDAFEEGPTSNGTNKGTAACPPRASKPSPHHAWIGAGTREACQLVQ